MEQIVTSFKGDGLELSTDLPAVQKILRHTDPRMTTETYGHLVPDYLRPQIDRPSFGPNIGP